MRAIDLFAGAGGFSTGAKMADCQVVWAANHWQSAVEIHALNHPEAQHVCQDLHQADWMAVPEHDLLSAFRWWAGAASQSQQVQGDAVAYFRRASSFGPWIECKPDESGSTRFVTGQGDDVLRDSERLETFVDWYLRDGKRSEIHLYGHITRTTREIVLAGLDAIAAEKKVTALRATQQEGKD